MIIAIDGTAGSGKGEIARRIAQKYGFSYLETGKLYRSVALKALHHALSLTDSTAIAQLSKTLLFHNLNDSGLEKEEIAQAASKISTYSEVRKNLLKFQRDFAQEHATPGVVLEGRDIGTVVCPDADLKLYIDCPVEIRAQRRFQQLQAQGHALQTYAQILASLKERDSRDKERSEAPLRIAEEAYVIDNTQSTLEKTLQEISSFIEGAASRQKTRRTVDS